MRSWSGRQRSSPIESPVSIPKKISEILCTHQGGIVRKPIVFKLLVTCSALVVSPLTPRELLQALGNAPVKVLPLKPGEKVEF